MSFGSIFYNSAMISCVIIFNENKPYDRKGKVLFIEAESEVTRKNAQSYLEDKHINRMLNAYNSFSDETGYCKVATNEDILSNGGKLSVSLFVEGKSEEFLNYDEAVENWKSSHSQLSKEYSSLTNLLFHENN